MKDYKRLTKWKINKFSQKPEADLKDKHSEPIVAITRLAELEDKIERGELISTVQNEQSEQEIEFFVKHNAEVRKQAVEGFAEKLRDKEFSAKIGSEWCAVVKSRDIDEFVKEGGVRRMKKIDGEYLVKLQAATIRKFAAEDCDFPAGRAIRANERAIQKWLDKITDDADEQRQILGVIERGNWNMEDTTL